MDRKTSTGDMDQIGIGNIKMRQTAWLQAMTDALPALRSSRRLGMTGIFILAWIEALFARNNARQILIQSTLQTEDFRTV